jgi:hypothetical protein
MNAHLERIYVAYLPGDDRHRCGLPGLWAALGRTATSRAFNARLRDELLNGQIFYTLREAQIVIESWRRHYNTIRLRASIGYKRPAPEVVVLVLDSAPG